MFTPIENENDAQINDEIEISVDNQARDENGKRGWPSSCPRRA